MKFSLLLMLPLLLFGHQLQAQNDSLAERTKMLSIVCRDFKVGPKDGAIIVKAIQYNRDKVLEVMRNKSISQEQKKSAIDKLMAEQHEQIKKMLTPQQQQRLHYLEMQQTLKSKARLDSLMKAKKAGR